MLYKGLGVVEGLGLGMGAQVLGNTWVLGFLAPRFEGSRFGSGGSGYVSIGRGQSFLNVDVELPCAVTEDIFFLFAHHAVLTEE